MNQHVDNSPEEWLPSIGQARRPFDARWLLPRLTDGIGFALSQTAALQRLRKISFLGAIDYTGFPSKRTACYLTSRFDHSVGVAALADYASQKLGHTLIQRNVAVAAALLHDAGHGPLSHSLEGSFEESFGINHHLATEQLLKSNSEASVELRAVLEKFGVRAEEASILMQGESEHPLNWLFKGPINFDTVEGILRAASYVPLKHGLQATALIDATISVMRGDDQAEDSVRKLDEFWRLKGLIYNQVVRGRIGVVSDFKCQSFFSSHKEKFTPEHFSLDDEAIAEVFPALFEWLRESAYPETCRLEANIPYLKRNFLIHSDFSGLRSGNQYLFQRYRQAKLQSHLLWKTTNGEKEWLCETFWKSDASSA
ncbi:MAG: HD domain-containing protein [Pseudomonadota bacterium]